MNLEPRRHPRLPSWLPKVWNAIQGRRTAHAIARNAQAITAITAVAATGVAGYGAVQANHAQHAVATLAARTRALETDTALATAQIANLRTSVRALDHKSAKAFKALDAELAAAGLAMDRLAAQVAALPPTPDLAPLNARVAKLAVTTSKAAKLALEASVSAAEQHDPEARAAAEHAADTAGAALAAAAAAQKAADAAQATADTLKLATDLAAALAKANDDDLRAQIAQIANNVGWTIDTIITMNNTMTVWNGQALDAAAAAQAQADLALALAHAALGDAP